MKTLHLTLNRQAFEVMVTGEKTEEYRKPSKWIEARLFEKGATLFPEVKTSKPYDQVKLVNGYGNDKPYFIAEFKGLRQIQKPNSSESYIYSNGLKVTVNEVDYIIRLGAILEVGNWDAEEMVPFCTGSEFLSWKDSNCDLCSRYEIESRTIGEASCKAAFRLDFSSVGDGSIPLHTANYIGMKEGRLCQFCKHLDIQR